MVIRAAVAKERAKAAVDWLDPATIFEMMCVKNFPEIMRITFDTIAVIFHLPLAPVEVVHSLFIHRGFEATFWRNSYEQSGRLITGPRFDLLKSLKTLDLESVNG